MPAPNFSLLTWLRSDSAPGHLWPRWLLLRAFGLIFFSAFYSLYFQIHGLLGPDGILPAGRYLELVGRQLGAKRFWYAPTLLWFGSGDAALTLVCVVGLVASVALIFNFWPRAAIAVSLVCFLSFVSAAQDFSEYQSDGMLLSAGFLSLFFAPPGLRPGLGSLHPPSRASRLLLLWLWFTIYFESGVVKLASGEPQWRNLTAMDRYYENGPLPNWIGWYAQQLPHGFHAAVALATLAIELGVAWMLFLPRRFRIICFFIVTPFQLGIVLTANLAFLNHFVLGLGVLLLDDQFLRHFGRWFATHLGRSKWKIEIGKSKREIPISASGKGPEASNVGIAAPPAAVSRGLSLVTEPALSSLKGHSPLLFLAWVFYVTSAQLLLLLLPGLPLPTAPIVALEPFRVANQYGLFAVMTRARYEIEFQGTRDGRTWIAYPFRYKPQDPAQPPGIHAPFQPRFDWNLWFASLGSWREYDFVVRTEERLLEGSPSVLGLFAGDPFAGRPPRQVRAVVWQYWFADRETKRAQGVWWRREVRGLYAPALELGPDGKPIVIDWPASPLAVSPDP